MFKYSSIASCRRPGSLHSPRAIVICFLWLVLFHRFHRFHSKQILNVALHHACGTAFLSFAGVVVGAGGARVHGGHAAVEAGGGGLPGGLLCCCRCLIIKNRSDLSVQYLLLSVLNNNQKP